MKQRGSEAGTLARPLAAEPAPPPLRRTCRILFATIVAAMAVVGLSRGGSWLTTHFFMAQDAPVLVVGLIVLGALTCLPLPARVGARAGAWMDAPARRPGHVAAWLAILTALGAAGGTYLVFHGFDLSRDEVMAEFDATILATGSLIAEIPPEWRPFRAALNPIFLLPVPGDVAWVSSYLPGNAALRALVEQVLDRGWTNPLLAGAATLALFAVARRLWPDRRDAVVVALLLFATSSQLLVMAMTSYAMTAHLAANLLWLWLFLRDDRRGHAGAMAVGFVACGLHQVVFHPLFAAPFVLQLWMRRRKRLALAYAAAYALFGAFWVGYWQIVLAGIDAVPGTGDGLGAGWLIERVLTLLDQLSPTAAVLMAQNLLRFVAWQHLLLLPLALAGAVAVRRDDGPARPLALGVILTLAAVAVLVPWQGHGWGYRYLHGLIGNICLLAGYGWIAATSGAGRAGRSAAVTAFGLTTLVALVLIPAHLAQAHAVIAPYRAAAEAIRRAPVDIVIVDQARLYSAGDLVRNDPFLRNRPIVMDLHNLDAERIRMLCARHSVAVFDHRLGTALGMPQADLALPPAILDHWARLRGLLADSGCAAPLAPDGGGQSG